MNKKIIISIIAIILIVILAVIVGKNLVKGEESANTNPVNSDATSSPEAEEPTQEPEETASPEPTETPSSEPTQNTDVSKMTVKQKQEYAESIAKKEWEKSNNNSSVYYSYEYMDEDKYIVTVRETGSTSALVWYAVDIKTGTCEKY